LISAGIASTALGLAVVVSGLSALYANHAVAGALQEISAISYEADSSSSFFENTPPRQQPVVPIRPAVVGQLAPIPTLGPVQSAPPVSLSLTNTAVSIRGRINNVNITFYDCKSQGFCGSMYNGRRVYEGAAACSWNLAIGTKFVILGDPTKRIYICEDRGLLANTWVDIFWHDAADGWRWQSTVGRSGSIEIVDLPAR
jgi:hypothetical protein